MRPAGLTRLGGRLAAAVGEAVLACLGPVRFHRAAVKPPRFAFTAGGEERR
jgi:hypothetical protein